MEDLSEQKRRLPPDAQRFKIEVGITKEDADDLREYLQRSLPVLSFDQSEDEAYIFPHEGYLLVTLAPAAAYVGKKAMDLLTDRAKAWLDKQEKHEMVNIYGPRGEIVKVVRGPSQKQ